MNYNKEPSTKKRFKNIIVRKINKKVLPKFEEISDISDFRLRKALNQNPEFRYRKLNKVPTKIITD